MSMTKKEAAELEQLRRENDALRKQLEGQQKSTIHFRVGDRIDGPLFYLDEHAPITFGGLQVRLDEDGWLLIHGDDRITLMPQASNAVRIHSQVRFRRSEGGAQ